MQVFRHTSELPANCRGGIVALGNFDGVHRGHQAVIGAARDMARAKNIPAGVLTFDPHPRAVLRPGLPPFQLTSWREKALVLADLGLDFMVVRHFDTEFAKRSAREFVEGELVHDLGAKGVVVGADFVFGRGREGGVAMLRQMSADLGFELVCLDTVAEAGGPAYSSSRVREALGMGKVRDAARLLGRDWEIEGRVEHGDERGRTIGFPTANVKLGAYVRPAFGVYAVRVAIGAEAKIRVPGIANIGKRPTFGGEEARLEAYLFDFNGDLYGKHLRVALVDFIRAERKFAGIEDLKAQITHDCDTARRILGSEVAGSVHP